MSLHLAYSHMCFFNMSKIHNKLGLNRNYFTKIAINQLMFSDMNSLLQEAHISAFLCNFFDALRRKTSLCNAAMGRSIYAFFLFPLFFSSNNIVMEMNIYTHNNIHIICVVRIAPTLSCLFYMCNIINISMIASVYAMTEYLCYFLSIYWVLLFLNWPFKEQQNTQNIIFEFTLHRF
ncbi:hypothetical protein ACJX0J_033670 [Zea mays]